MKTAGFLLLVQSYLYPQMQTLANDGIAQHSPRPSQFCVHGSKLEQKEPGKLLCGDRQATKQPFLL